MIQRIRNSRAIRLLSVYLILNLTAQIVAPMSALALTGGPAQPEFGSFTPVNASNMVDLSSGDMNYNVPLMDVGGYPLNIAYSSGTGMDDEASWVGLGWNLSVGQVSRNVRGIPDDFQGDELIYENHMKPNVTVGANLTFQPGAFGVDLEGNKEFSPDNYNVGLAVMYNNYTGFTAEPSLGLSAELNKNVSVGFNVRSGNDGLAVSSQLSIHEDQNKETKKHKISCKVGVGMNSRQGLTSTSLGMTKKTTYKKRSSDTDASYAANKNAKGGPSIGSAIGFAEHTYTPSKRVGMSTGTFTFNASFGVEMTGIEGQADITAYGTIQKVKASEKYKLVRSYGYEHTERAKPVDVVDFNREKEGVMSVNATNAPVTSYTYDIYSVQGQGVGGMYRPYRNQIGYVFDPLVQDGSFSGSLGLEFGSGNMAHVGVDIEMTPVSSWSGLWEDQNYMLSYLKENFNYNPRYEKVHFKNVGDLSVDEEMSNNYTTIFNKTGRYQPTRVSFVGNKFHRRAVAEYKTKFDGEGHESLISAGVPARRSQRQARNQAVFNLSLEEVRGGIGYGPLAVGESAYNTVHAKSNAPKHHTGEVQIIRNDGARYIYGLPAYNKQKREATFAVYNTSANQSTGLVGYAAGVDNSAENNIHDQYFNRVTTPAYAHTYLLTSVLSADYQDRSGDGPSPDDLGGYTKFTYDLKDDNYKWRVPYEQNKASYNEGLKTDDKDDRGNYVYGEKELFYIKKIETKTHVAIFKISTRHDAHGVLGENGGLNQSDASYKLDEISLYAKPEYDAQGAGAIPIKVVHFEYSYELCGGVPNNDGIAEIVNGTDINAAKGKLTLKRIYFTYRDSKMGKYTGFKFHYDNLNPDYNLKGYDYWGNYKPNNGTGAIMDASLTAPEYAYTEQDYATQASYAAAWTMSSIDLPSGGTISVMYESDDYAYVQDKKALRMYQVLGAGDSETWPVDMNNISCELYANTLTKRPNKYLYLKVGSVADVGGITADDLLTGVGSLVQFRFLLNMTQAGGSNISSSTYCDYVSGYMQLDSGEGGGQPTAELSTIGGNVYARIRVKMVDRNGGSTVDNAVHPVTMAGWNFGRKYLNKYVTSNLPNGDTDDLEEMMADLLSSQVMSNLIEFVTGPNATLERRNIARNFRKNKGWVRLGVPTGHKYGGGCRVREIRMSDIWQAMNNNSTNYQTMNYGQKYTYTLADGRSSGVATYEPVGNGENPFVQPVYSTVKHLLAPDEDNYVELPFGESFFPNPQVTYSRVRVESLSGGTNSGYEVKKLHRTGHIITEFYTSRDYPTLTDETILDHEEDKRDIIDNLLKINRKKHFTASQGFVIHLNDMNGKQKSQRVFAADQEGFISGVDYLYDNYSTPENYNATMYPERNKGRLNNEVKVIYPNGDVRMKVIGVEEDMVNDFMTNESESMTMGMNTNLATFFVGIIPGVVPTMLPDISQSRDKLCVVSTTKVINTFGILKETIAYEDGAAVATRNLAWDAVTGEVLVTETTDEFDDKYYTFNYPAHWYYNAMGQAAQNLGFTGKISPLGGAFTLNGLGGSMVSDFLIAGDEIVYGSGNTHAWVSSVGGNDFTLMDFLGDPITSIDPDTPFKVIRSGHRNLQSAGIMNVTLMKNPLKNSAGGDVANIGGDFLKTIAGDAGNDWKKWRIINAGAVDYSDNWPAGCECKFALGTLEIRNPYVNNSRGVWRVKSSRTYLTGRNRQDKVNPRVEGFYTSFVPMYRISHGGHFIKDITNWTFVSEVSKYSPYGFEQENKDALNRYSAAQYGYNNTLPMAVGANTEYRQIGFDGFEDYDFNGCLVNRHFGFHGSGLSLSSSKSHTGRHSIIVPPSSSAIMEKPIQCTTP